MSHLVLFQVLTQCLAAAIQLLKCLTSKILTVCQNKPPPPPLLHTCTHYTIHKPRNVRNLVFLVHASFCSDHLWPQNRRETKVSRVEHMASYHEEKPLHTEELLSRHLPRLPILAQFPDVKNLIPAVKSLGTGGEGEHLHVERKLWCLQCTASGSTAFD